MALLNVKITIPALLEYDTEMGEAALKGAGEKAIMIAPTPTPTPKEVKEVKEVKDPATKGVRLIRAEEVAKMTGFSVYTIYDYAKEGIIPCIRPKKRRIYFEKSEVEKWMRGLSVKYAVR